MASRPLKGATFFDSRLSAYTVSVSSPRRNDLEEPVIFPSQGTVESVSPEERTEAADVAFSGAVCSILYEERPPFRLAGSKRYVLTPNRNPPLPCKLLLLVPQAKHQVY
jgi:hypothetical protein